MRRWTFALALFVFAACDPSRTLVVESDATWEGGIFGPRGSEWVEGTGDARYPLDFGAEYCWHFEATRADGTVRVYIEDATVTGPGGTPSEGHEAAGCT